MSQNVQLNKAPIIFKQKDYVWINHKLQKWWQNYSRNRDLSKQLHQIGPMMAVVSTNNVSEFFENVSPSWLTIIGKWIKLEKIHLDAPIIVRPTGIMTCTHYKTTICLQNTMAHMKGIFIKSPFMTERWTDTYLPLPYDSRHCRRWQNTFPSMTALFGHDPAINNINFTNCTRSGISQDI